MSGKRSSTMFGHRETATQFDNGKRNVSVGHENLKADYRAAVEAIINSTIPLDELPEIFGAAGLIVVPTSIQYIAARRNAKLVAGQTRL